MTGNKTVKIGIVDTTFSRVNMGEIALDEIEKIKTKTLDPRLKTIRRTVPGIKDLSVECKLLLETGCDIVMALGMVGGAPIDIQCGHEASLGIQQAKLMTNKHIIEVFVHENETWNDTEFFEICDNRIRKHVHNAIDLVLDPAKLVVNAGKGIRQGKANEGEIGINGIEIDENVHTIGIVVCEFNREITEVMEKTAIERIKTQDLGCKTRDSKLETRIMHVPGAYDSPLAVKKLLMDKKISGVVVLGAIIKGGTKHDEIIAQSTANALTALSLEYKKPIALGIIGPGATEEQADARKQEYAKRAVDAVIKMIKELQIDKNE